MCVRAHVRRDGWGRTTLSVGRFAEPTMNGMEPPRLPREDDRLRNSKGDLELVMLLASLQLSRLALSDARLDTVRPPGWSQWVCRDGRIRDVLHAVRYHLALLRLDRATNALGAHRADLRIEVTVSVR